MNNFPSDIAKDIMSTAEKAGEILLKYFKKDINVSYKQDELDPVTVADKESDDFLRAEIGRLFPNDSILSEESNLLPESYSGRVWMIDPLDATKSFINGSDTFSINIGLVDDGIPILGCVVFPAQNNKVFYAEKGLGAYVKNGSSYIKLVTSEVDSIEKSILVTREPSGGVRPIEEKLNTLPFLKRITGGSIGDKLGLLAENKADVCINTNVRISKWDTAGPQVILEEAGGVVTDLYGNPINYKAKENGLSNSFVASANKNLHECIMNKLPNLNISL